MEIYASHYSRLSLASNTQLPIDLEDPGERMTFDNIGALDAEANRVEADGRFFSVSRDSHLEEHSYGLCPRDPADVPSRSETQD